eukprot:10908014-Alexandrium_andersonii.AAC.1
MPGQDTYPDAATFARATEEDFRSAVSDRGYFERPGDTGVITKVPLGLMDKGRLLMFRSEVIDAYKKPRGFSNEAQAPSAKK